MAFVHRSTRGTSLQVQSTTSPSLGPGSYNTLSSPTANISSSTKVRLSYAPFSSSSERGMMEERYGAIGVTPGPGEYTTSSAAKVAFSHTAPIVTNAFVSAVPRFGREAETQPGANVPGPGAYEHPSSFSAKRSASATAHALSSADPTHAHTKRRGGFEWVRVSAPPSIPTPSQSFGYEENNSGELILQTPQRLPGHTGRGVDRVGPGEYLSTQHENIVAHGRKRGFVEWSKSKTHRDLSSEKKVSSSPGPGSYVASSETTTTRRTAKKISPFFASKVARLNNANAVDGSAASSSSHDSIPGPGTYGINSEFDRISSQFVPSQYQFFGSKTKRVVGGILASTNPTPGPGTYSSGGGIAGSMDGFGGSSGGVSGSTSVAVTQDPYIPHRPFRSTSKRFEEHKETYVSPGPGAYSELPNTSYELSKRSFTRNTSFGTTEQRFVEKEKEMRRKEEEKRKMAQQATSMGGSSSSTMNTITEVSPVSYSPRQHSSIRLNRKPLSVFVSTTKRFNAANGQSASEEKMSLEKSMNGVTSARESQPHGIGHTPTYGNYSKMNAQSSSFATKQPRFDTRAVMKQLEKSAAIGPGSYDTNPGVANGSNIYHTSPAVSSSFKNSERTTLNSVYKKELGPGPGAYTKDVSNPHNSTLIRRSFNITIANEI